MSLSLKGKNLIAYLLKNPNTIKYKSSYYKFNHKYRSPISLDDFYIFCLNYSYIEKIKKNNYFKFYKELINCINNLEIKPGERNLLPFSAYFHFYDFDYSSTIDISFKKSQEIKKTIENINRAIFTQISFSNQCEHPLTPLENIKFFKVTKDKKCSPSIELSCKFRFNPFIKKHHIYNKFSLTNSDNFCKDALILANLRNKSITHQKVFENVILEHLQSLTSLRQNPAHLINFFLKKKLISPKDFYTKPIFTLQGKNSPLNIIKTIQNKTIVVNNKEIDLEAFYPFSLNLFQLHNKLSIRDLTLAHLFSICNISSKSKIEQFKYSQLIQTIDYNKFKYGFEFLLTSLIEMNEDNLFRNRKIIEDNLEKLKPLFFNIYKPKIKDPNLFILSPLFTFILEKNYFDIDSQTLEKNINIVKQTMDLKNLQIHKKLSNNTKIKPNFFKRKKIVLFNEDKIERIENILLHKQLKEDNIKQSNSHNKKIKIHKF